LLLPRAECKLLKNTVPSQVSAIGPPTNATTVDLLFTQFNVLNKLVKAKMLIVTSEALDAEAMMLGHAFKRVLRLDGLA